MLNIEITETKNFVKKLLMEPVFDTFLLVEAYVRSDVSYTIDGRLNPSFFDTEELEEMTSKTYTTWGTVRHHIFNVIKGEMSLVGPRPYLPCEKEKIGNFLPVICMTTPGITGLWQVSGRNDISFNGRLQLDSWYVRNWSLWQDIVLLFKTIGVVCGKKGAY